MAISTVSQKGLDAPLTLTSPVLTSPAFSGTPTGTLVSANMPTGSVLQVVSVNNPSNPAPTTSSAVTLLTTTFTPKFATSKVLAMMTTTVERGGGGSGNYIFISLQRNGSVVSTNWANALCYAAANGVRGVGAQNYLDSPATTSAITYSYVADFSTSGNINWYVYNLNLTLMEIAA